MWYNLRKHGTTTSCSPKGNDGQLKLLHFRVCAKNLGSPGRMRIRNIIHFLGTLNVIQGKDHVNFHSNRNPNSRYKGWVVYWKRSFGEKPPSVHIYYQISLEWTTFRHLFLESFSSAVGYIPTNMRYHHLAINP